MASATGTDLDRYLAFVRRIIQATVRRVDEVDPEQFHALLDLQADLDLAITTAVRGLRDAGYTWEEISQRTGTTRQSAWERWSTKVRRVV